MKILVSALFKAEVFIIRILKNIDICDFCDNSTKELIVLAAVKIINNSQSFILHSGTTVLAMDRHPQCKK